MDKRISGQYRLAHLFHARDDAFFRHQISSRVNVAVAIQRSVLIKKPDKREQHEFTLSLPGETGFIIKAGKRTAFRLADGTNPEMPYCLSLLS